MVGSQRDNRRGPPSVDEKLDEELEQTFPASDAPTITRSIPAPARAGRTSRIEDKPQKG